MTIHKHPIVWAVLWKVPTGAVRWTGENPNFGAEGRLALASSVTSCLLASLCPDVLNQESIPSPGNCMAASSGWEESLVPQTFIFHQITQT